MRHCARAFAACGARLPPNSFLTTSATPLAAGMTEGSFRKASLGSLAFAPTLVDINLGRNQIQQLPASLASLPNLQRLDVSYNQLQTTQPISEMRNLVSLNVNAVASRGGPGSGAVAEIATMLPPVGSAHCLEEFFGGFNRLGCVPKPLLSARWPALQTIELGNNALT